MCNCETPLQIYTLGNDGGGKNIIVTTLLIKINVNTILSIYRDI